MRLVLAALFASLLACASAGRPPPPPPESPAAPPPRFGLVVPATGGFALRLPPGAARPSGDATLPVFEVATERWLTVRLAEVADGGAEELPVRWVGDSMEAARVGVAVLDGSGRGREQFQECTSAEGVHVTIWSGAPLASPCIWHGYWHAGYDLDETCEPAALACGEAR